MENKKLKNKISCLAVRMWELELPRWAGCVRIENGDVITEHRSTILRLNRQDALKDAEEMKAEMEK